MRLTCQAPQQHCKIITQATQEPLLSSSHFFMTQCVFRTRYALISKQPIMPSILKRALHVHMCFNGHCRNCGNFSQRGILPNSPSNSKSIILVLHNIFHSSSMHHAYAQESCCSVLIKSQEVVGLQKNFNSSWGFMTALQFPSGSQLVKSSKRD